MKIKIKRSDKKIFAKKNKTGKFFSLSNRSRNFRTAFPNKVFTVEMETLYFSATSDISFVNKYLFHNNSSHEAAGFPFQTSQNPVMFFIIFFKCQVNFLQIGSIMKISCFLFI